MILENPELTSIELENVRLLLMKMRIPEEKDCNEYITLEIVLEILNNGKISENVLEMLRPIIKRKENYLFFLGNSEYEKSILNTSDFYCTNRQIYLNKSKYLN